MFEKILIATDGSKHSERAAEMGVEIARLSGGKITAAYVADTGRLSHLPADMALASIRDIMLMEGDEATEHVKKLANKAGITCEKVVAEGNPSEELLKLGEGMDLVVMGRVGRSGLDRFLLGSVAEKIVRNSKVPVLAVPGDET
jgi:nucleotide-binding universal stress UspA family protein